MIRNGTYTRISDRDYKILFYRDDTPDENDFVTLLDENGKSLDAGFNPRPDGFSYKKYPKSELTNAYRVSTVGDYKGLKVQVFSIAHSNNVCIASRLKDEALKLGLIESNINWFTADVAPECVNNIREEYSLSDFDVPMPVEIIKDGI